MIRKTLHVGIVAVAYVGLFVDVRLSVLVCALSLVCILLARLSRAFAALRHATGVRSYGDVLLPLGILATLVLATQATPEALFLPFFIIGVADPLAALVGKSWTFVEYRIWGERRTISGNVTFFLASFVAVLALSQAVLIEALLLAFLLTVVENVSVRGSDNLTLPLAALFFAG